MAQNVLLYVITNFLEGGEGEFSLGTPLLTAYFPTFIGASLLLIQFAGNVVLNHWWAEGNLYLIAMQLFSFSQFYAMTQVLWDVHNYLYGMRVIRYIFSGAAVVFMLIYWIAGAILLDLMFVKGKIAGRDRPVDLMFALFIGYNLIELFPTAFCNTFIILKELTMNQLAFSAEEDFTPGMLLDKYNIDIFTWFNIDGNPELYKQYVVDWTHEFL